jgi:hypothetical protein
MDTVTEEKTADAEAAQLRRIQLEQSMTRSIEIIAWILGTLRSAQYPGAQAQQVVTALDYLEGLKRSLEGARLTNAG